MSSTYSVQTLLSKINASDPDLRFMSLTDLNVLLNSSMFSVSPEVEKKMVSDVISSMSDSNAEVRGISVKVLGAFVDKISEDRLLSIIDKLLEKLRADKLEDSTLAGLGLKIMSASIPTRSTLIMDHLLPKLLIWMDSARSCHPELILDVLDVISDILGRSSGNVKLSPKLQTRILETLLPLLNHERDAVVRRVIKTFGSLITVSSDLTAACVLQHAQEKFQKNVGLRLLNTVAKSNSKVFESELLTLIPRLSTQAKIAMEDENEEYVELTLAIYDTAIFMCSPLIASLQEIVISDCSEWLQFDLNFAGDMDVEMGSGDESEDGIDDEGFDNELSDEEDLAWRIRRASVKTLSTLISAKSSATQFVLSKAGKSLASRLDSERVESVRLEIFSFWNIVASQSRQIGLCETNLEQGNKSPRLKRKRDSIDMIDAADGIYEHVDNIMASIVKQIQGKSTICKTASFKLTYNLLSSSIRITEPHLRRILQLSLSEMNKSNDTVLSISIIQCLVRSLDSMIPDDSSLDSLQQNVIHAIDQPVPTISMQAFLLARKIVDILPRPTHGGSKDLIRAFYESALATLSDAGADKDLKDAALVTVSKILATSGADVDVTKALPVLSVRLANFVTQHTTADVISQIVASSTIPVSESSFDQWAISCVRQLFELSRQRNRALRISSFRAIAAIIKRSGHYMTENHSAPIIQEISSLLKSEMDTSSIPECIDILTSLASASKKSLKALHSMVIQDLDVLLQKSCVAQQSSSHAINFFSALGHSDPESVQDLAVLLLGFGEKQQIAPDQANALSLATKCLAVLVIASPGVSEPFIQRLVESISDPTLNPSLLTFKLFALGEIGSKIDLSDQDRIFALIGSIQEQQAANDGIVAAAAFAAGNVAASPSSDNVAKLTAGLSLDIAHQLFALRAISEYLHRVSITRIKNSSDLLWQGILSMSESSDEQIRSLSAICIASIMTSDSQKFIGLLKTASQSTSASTRTAVMIALRNFITTSPLENDEILKLILTEFMQSMDDPDPLVRRNTVSLLNVCANRKATFMNRQTINCLDMLYKETLVRPELRREVAMGPFKHIIDDGLDNRKAAYDCMYTLLCNCSDIIDLPEFMEKVFAALQDVDEIKLLAYLIFAQVAQKYPQLIASKIDDISANLLGPICCKQKDTANKTEIEKASELQKAAVRLAASLQKAGEETRSQKYEQLMREILSNKNWSAVFHAAVEAKAQ